MSEGNRPFDGGNGRIERAQAHRMSQVLDGGFRLA
jgi:hypothetical protein